MRKPWPMWWALLLLSSLGVLRLAALACTPAPTDMIGLTVRPVRLPWGPSFSAMFLAFLSGYTDPIARSGHVPQAALAEILFILIYLGSAYSAWAGRESGMKVGFTAAVVQVLTLVTFAGLPWVVVLLGPALMTGLGLASGPAREDGD